jgi:hypothetical protein
MCYWVVIYLIYTYDLLDIYYYLLDNYSRSALYLFDIYLPFVCCINMNRGLHRSLGPRTGK